MKPITIADLSLGQTVSIYKYHTLYQGRIVSIGRTRVAVEFTLRGNGIRRRREFHWQDVLIPEPAVPAAPVS